MMCIANQQFGAQNAKTLAAETARAIGTVTIVPGGAGETRSLATPCFAETARLVKPEVCL